jgi:hypothetical protein
MHEDDLGLVLAPFDFNHLPAGARFSLDHRHHRIAKITQYRAQPR